MRLADWQLAFVEALSPQGDSSPLSDLVKEGEQDRLKIYHNNAFQALNNALQQVFSVCQIVVGERCFSQLVKGYMRQYPLTELNLNSYGQHFSTWLATEIRQHSGFATLPYLGELAQLEWLLNQSYYAMDKACFMQAGHYELTELAALTDVQQSKVTLLLAPDVSLFTCRYPVHHVVNRHQTGKQFVEVKADPRPAAFMTKQDDELHHLVVYRQGYQALFTGVEFAEMQLLQAIAAEQTLSSMSALELDLSLLPGLITRRWVCGFTLSAIEQSDG